MRFYYTTGGPSQHQIRGLKWGRRSDVFRGQIRARESSAAEVFDRSGPLARAGGSADAPPSNGGLSGGGNFQTAFSLSRLHPVCAESGLGRAAVADRLPVREGRQMHRRATASSCVCAVRAWAGRPSRTPARAGGSADAPPSNGFLSCVRSQGMGGGEAEPRYDRASPLAVKYGIP